MTEKSQNDDTPDAKASLKYDLEMPFLKPIVAETDFYKVLRGEPVEGLSFATVKEHFNWLMDKGPISTDSILKLSNVSIGDPNHGWDELKNLTMAARARVAQTYTIFELQMK